MTQPRVLIACMGNIFLGDDGFGTEALAASRAGRCRRASF
jgi:Ni,Fe-hydrogenase maturation factor